MKIEIPDNKHNLPSEAPLSPNLDSQQLPKKNKLIQADDPAEIDLLWSKAPKAESYRLLLNGVLYKDHLLVPRYTLNLIDFKQKLESIAFEAIDGQARVVEHIAEIVDFPLLLSDKAVLNMEKIWQKSLYTETMISVPGYVWYKKCNEKYNLPNYLESDDEWLNHSNEKIYGTVFDEQNRPLDDVKIRLRSLNSSTPFFDETTTIKGKYAFPCSISGIQMEITASKPGYASRKRVEVQKSNKGEPNANRYDFGFETPLGSNFSAPYFALSDKPEIIQAFPARNSKDLAPNTAIKLTFSEPMDRASVENNFTIRAYQAQKFSVDQRDSKATFLGPGRLADYRGGTPIYDSSAFELTWNADDSEVTFKFKHQQSLPTDKNIEQIPSYSLAFDNFATQQRAFKDRNGVERKEKHFKLTDGDFEEAYKFSVAPDSTPPELVSVQLLNSPEKPPLLALTYSESMLIPALAAPIAGGMGDSQFAREQAPAGYPGSGAGAIQASHNYFVKVNRQKETLFSGTWGSLGGQSQYAAWDHSYKTVLLLPGPYWQPLHSGDQIELIVAQTVSDPAGNAISPKHNRASVQIQ